MRPPRRLLLGLRRLHRALFGALAGELVVRPGPVGQLAVLQMQDAAHGAVQKPAIVADDDDRMGVFRQIAFQPQRPFKVEIVGRFVQKQIVGLREQHPRQRHPHPPAAREIRTGAQLVLKIEAQALEDRRCPRLCRPGVDIGQPVLDLGDPVRIGRVIGLGHQRRALLIRRQHGVEQRDRRRRHLLRHAADLRAARQRDRAALQCQLAPDQPEERRLARAVRADKTDLVAGGNGGRGALEKGAPLDRIGDVTDP